MEKFEGENDHVGISGKIADSKLDLFATNKSLNEIVTIKLVDRYLSQIFAFTEDCNALLQTLNATNPIADHMGITETSKYRAEIIDRVRPLLSKLEQTLSQATEMQSLDPLLNITRDETFRKILKVESKIFEKTPIYAQSLINLQKLISASNSLDKQYINHSEQLNGALKKILIDYRLVFDGLSVIKSDIANEALIIRNKMFEDMERIQKTVSDIEVKYANDLDKFTKYYDENMESIRKAKEELDSILKVASNDLLSNEYGKGATNEKGLADNFRNAAISCIALMTCLIVWSLFSSMSYGFDIEQSVFKFMIGIFLGLPATYFAKESNRHRVRQHRLHEVMIELNTINAFVKDLPAQEQVRIKGEFASKLFGKDKVDCSVANVLPDNSLQILSDILAKFDFKKN